MRSLAPDIPVPISIKTRLGWSDTAEFEDILKLYRKYPLSELIVHMRLKTDQYKGEARTQVLLNALDEVPLPARCERRLVTERI